jgi:hypothetical protein
MLALLAVFANSLHEAAPTWETDSSSARQGRFPHFTEREVSLPHSQQTVIVSVLLQMNLALDLPFVF